MYPISLTPIRGVTTFYKFLPPWLNGIEADKLDEHFAGVDAVEIANMLGEASDAELKELIADESIRAAALRAGFGRFADFAVPEQLKTMDGVELEETGGLFGGSGVTYRGVHVGKVESVKLDDGRIVARVNLDPAAHIPADSTAKVRTLSPAGEQYLDFQPTASKGPWLKDGDTMASARTTVPTSIATALQSIDSLMSQIDDKDLTTVLDELHVAFADPEDLASILTSGTNIVDMLDERWPQTLRTLENALTMLRTGVDSKSQFVELAASLQSLTASLEDYDPKLRTILDKTPEQVKEIRELTASIAQVLPSFLTAADDLTGTLVDCDPHLRALLTDFPKGLQRLADTIEEGFLRVNMLVSPGEVCSYGVNQSSPRSTDREPAVPGRRCTANVSGQQRGSAHVPAPLR